MKNQEIIDRMYAGDKEASISGIDSESPIQTIIFRRKQIYRPNEKGGEIMTKWTKNLLQYSENKNPGKCPVCGSTDVNVEEHHFGRRASLTFRCCSCKATEHFDGFSEGYPIK